MTLRRATLDDLSALLRMGANFVLETSYRGKVVPDATAVVTLIGELLAHGFVLVAVDDKDVVVGMLAATAWTHQMTGERTAAELAWWIDPAHRTPQLASDMLAGYEAWARADGAVVAQVQAPAGSRVGVLYARRGYAELETTYQRRIA